MSGARVLQRGKIKRFYEAVAVDAVPDGGYRILLDGRPVRTPGKTVLSVPSVGLAQAIADEWAAPEEEIDPRAMPLTALACTAIDLIGPGRERIVREVAAYGGHDLVCYRAEGPADLAACQQAAWQPLVDWSALSLDAALNVTSGIVSVAQPPAALAALRRAVESLSDIELAALSAAVTAAGSLVIALALHAGRIDAETAFAVALLDELYQAERWGDDPEAARRRAAIKADLDAAARAFALLRG